MALKMRASQSGALIAAVASLISIYVWWKKKRSTAAAKQSILGESSASDITVIGDVFADILLHLPASQDGAPPLVWGGDLLLESAVEVLPGGSGLNTATHLSVTFSSSATTTTSCVTLWSAIGSDQWGDTIRSHARRCGVRLRGVLSAPSTGVCAVLTDSQDRSFATHRGPIADLSLSSAPSTGVPSPDNALDVVEILRSTKRHLHIAGYYNCPKLWGAPLGILLRSARECGLTTSLNAQFDASEEWGHLAGSVLPFVDIVIMSRDEAAAISGIPRAWGGGRSSDLQAFHAAHATSIRAGHWFVDEGVKVAIVTLGAAGALAVVEVGGQRAVLQQPVVSSSPDGDDSSSSSDPISVVDTTGAGDAFNAGFLSGWVREWHDEGNGSAAISPSGKGESVRLVAAVREGLRWGCAAGTCCVGHLGASVPVALDHVARFLPAHPILVTHH